MGLVAANAPALKHLSLDGLELGEQALDPVMEALRSNTHLEELSLDGNGLSMQFFQRHLEAISACTSLRKLPPLTRDGRPLERMLKALKREAEKEAAAERAAAEGAA